MKKNIDRVTTTVVTFMDILAIIVSMQLSNYLRNGTFCWMFDGFSDESIWLYIIAMYLGICFFRNTAKYYMRRGIFEELIEVLKNTIALWAGLIVTMFTFKISAEFSRLAMGYFFVLTVGISFMFRGAYKYYLKWVSRNSHYTKRLVIVTMMDDVEKILARLDQDDMWQYKLKGLILLDATDEMIEQDYHGLQVMGNLKSMYDCLTQRVVDEVFIYLPYTNGVHISQTVERYEAMGLTVNLNINIFDVELQHKHKELRRMGDCHVVTFRESVVDFKMKVVKRCMDVVGALVGLVITGIVTIFLAPILLLESPGPLIYASTRVGLNGRRFKFYKFRSMYRDADAHKKELMEQNEMSGLMFKMKDDPRVTKVGAFIRKTSIDELPQFWNVLKGDMSLIGTRPPTEDEFEQYEAQYKRRLSIKPGITGMWQAMGRSDITDFEDVMALDLQYIDNWSIGLDLKILVYTILGVFMRKGAK